MRSERRPAAGLLAPWSVASTWRAWPACPPSAGRLRWRYVLELPVDGKTYHVDFDDWMFLMDERVMLNRSVMSKFGFRLGEVTLSFYKRDS